MAKDEQLPDLVMVSTLRRTKGPRSEELRYV